MKQNMFPEPIPVGIVESIEKFTTIVLTDGTHLRMKWAPLKVWHCGHAEDGSPIYNVQSVPMYVLDKPGPGTSAEPIPSLSLTPNFGAPN
jgi:hypothetical protein